MSEKYTIKPLVWERCRPDDPPPFEWWIAHTIFGIMEVEQGNGVCQWKYCFDEYYDEAEHDCESIEHGKAEAEAFYRTRLRTALEPAK